MNPLQDQSSKKNKTPWPTKRAMQQVYEKQLWGVAEQLFYSGEGSHHQYIVKPYLKEVQAFLRSQATPFILCDLGCGDFNIGKQLAPLTQKYIGLDIVPELITHLQENYLSPQLQFECKNLAKDPFPNGDVAVLRQVLQHLSNSEIDTILKKLPQYQYVIITEHLPIGEFKPNLDIISGQGIRLKKKSGVVVQQSPFYFTFKKSQLLSEVYLENNKGVIQTMLYTMF